MKAFIQHESRGRLRVRMHQYRMSLEQADLLEAYLPDQPGVKSAAVHERTCCATVCYTGSRAELLHAIGRFDYRSPAVTALAPQHSGRALNREYQEKLVTMVAVKAACTLFLPTPLQIVRTVCMAAPFLCRGLRRLLRGQLRVEVLDALSIGVSMARRDFGTAGSVMFLLQLGELLEEWTHKKSVDDLARTMSLGVSRVWLQKDGTEVSVPLSQIASGDRIVVRTGSVIPFDGEIVSGEVAVNQASLTGESVPVIKRPGAKVFAGTVIEEGDCVIEVTQQAGESRYYDAVETLQNADDILSGDNDIAAKIEEYRALYPVSLTDLSPSGGEDCSQNWTAYDANGNAYSNGLNFSLYPVIAKTVYTEYAPNGQYKRLTGTWVVEGDTSDDFIGTVRIYVDDHLQYEVSSLTVNSPASALSLSISDASTVRIEVKGEFASLRAVGYLYLADAKFEN